MNNTIIVTEKTETSNAVNNDVMIFIETMYDESIDPNDYISIDKIQREILPQRISNVVLIWNGSPKFRLREETTNFSLVVIYDYRSIFDIPDSEIYKVKANDEYYIGNRNYPRDCINIKYFNEAIQPLIEQYNK